MQTPPPDDNELIPKFNAATNDAASDEDSPIDEFEIEIHLPYLDVPVVFNDATLDAANDGDDE
jgi:hypothetical protein